MSKGRFGIHGGQYVPETLMNAVLELEEAYNHYKDDPEFNRELADLLKQLCRTSVSSVLCSTYDRRSRRSKSLSEERGSEPYRSTQDQQRSGTGFTCKKMGKTRVIAETGAGQHGVATATAAALMGMECEVFMGKEDTERQALNVYRMRLLGAKVHAVTSGTATLKDAVSETMREWTNRIRYTLCTRFCHGTASVPDNCT